MTLRRIDSGQARLLALAVKYDFPERTKDWLKHLEEGNLTDEMRAVFEAFGYLERNDRRQRRPRIAPVLDPLLEEQDIERAVEAEASKNGQFHDDPKPQEDPVEVLGGWDWREEAPPNAPHDPY